MKDLYENRPFLCGILFLFSGPLITLAAILLPDCFFPGASSVFAYIAADVAIPAGMALASLCFLRVIRLEPKNTRESLLKTGFCAMIIVMTPIFILTCTISLIRLLF